MNAVVLIPARIGSTRLPEKLLLRETGKSVLQHTYEAATNARLPRSVWIAVDDLRLLREVRSFGGHAIMTDPRANSGTDRIAEAASQLDEVDIIVNVQADEPEIDPQAIDQVIELLRNRPNSQIATLATRIESREALFDPNCVKVVFDDAGNAIYFSRSPIPFPRDGLEHWTNGPPPHYFQHLGLYAYRRNYLLEFAQMPTSSLERTECLEQLRALQAGHSIAIGITPHRGAGIDTADDYAAFVRRHRQTCSRSAVA